MLLTAGFRWLKARKTIRTGSKANLTTADAVTAEARNTVAVETQAKLKEHPALIIEAKRGVQAGSHADLQYYTVADAKAKRKIAVSVKAAIQCYLIGLLHAVKTIPMGHKAKLGSASSATAQGKRTIQTGTKAAIGSAGTVGTTAHNVVPISVKASLNSASSTSAGAKVTVPIGVKAVIAPATAKSVSANRAVQIGSKASLTLGYSVTFRNNDGKQLHVGVAVSGRDCPDPVISGELEPPTGVDTAQYYYGAFLGWSRENGGDVDETALSNITQPTTLYAVYEKTLRYYNISFYDDDLTTLFTTLSVAYGDIPSYTPTKSGCVFESWYPSVVAVTGDAVYYAQWKEVPTFATASWETIAQLSESGEASSCFALGDTKDVTLTDGTQMTFEIIGFDHDDLADGTGKAGITVLSKYALSGKRDMYGIVNARNINWSATDIRKSLNSGTIYGTIPDEIKAVVKTVTKKTSATGSRNKTLVTSSDKFWLPSCTEVGYEPTSSIYFALNQGVRYPVFTKSTDKGLLKSTLLKTEKGSTTYRNWWLRSPSNEGSYANFMFIGRTPNGTYASISSTACWKGLTIDTGVTIVFGFCI